VSGVQFTPWPPLTTWLI